MDAINPRFKKHQTASFPDNGALVKALRTGNRAALSRALTLTESAKTSHRRQAEELVQMALPYSGQALRIGITGVPGVGKSTFIEAFGGYLIEQGKKVAVLSIDPSSALSKGSILGDKTRMPQLAQQEAAFIRPSPSSGTLGGVARKTRESILLCEAAGYDVILVETVGVGQSETVVKSMVDFFILLLLAGAGDELQGIKRGIMEMADLLLLNKADETDAKLLRRATGDYQRALHLFPPKANEWIPEVAQISALKAQGIAAAWEVIERFARQQKTKGYFEAERKRQGLAWFREALQQDLLESLLAQGDHQKVYTAIEEAVRAEELSPPMAVRRFLQTVLKEK